MDINGINIDSSFIKERLTSEDVKESIRNGRKFTVFDQSKGTHKISYKTFLKALDQAILLSLSNPDKIGELKELKGVLKEAKGYKTKNVFYRLAYLFDGGMAEIERKLKDATTPQGIKKRLRNDLYVLAKGGNKAAIKEMVKLAETSGPQFGPYAIRCLGSLCKAKNREVRHEAWDELFRLYEVKNNDAIELLLDNSVKKYEWFDYDSGDSGSVQRILGELVSPLMKKCDEGNITAIRLLSHICLKVNLEKEVGDRKIDQNDYAKRLYQCAYDSLCRLPESERSENDKVYLEKLKPYVT